MKEKDISLRIKMINQILFALFHYLAYSGEERKTIKQILQGENTIRGSMANLISKINKDDYWFYLSMAEKTKTISIQ